MGLEVYSCTRAWGSVPGHGGGLGHRAVGQAVLASHRKGNIRGQRRGEEADRPRNAAGHGAASRAAGTKLGNRAFPSTCEMLSPDL